MYRSLDVAVVALRQRRERARTLFASAAETLDDIAAGLAALRTSRDVADRLLMQSGKRCG